MRKLFAGALLAAVTCLVLSLGASADCPCPHGSGTWFHYKVDHDLSFVGSVTENAYNARWANGELVYQTHPKKYTIADCYGPDQQRVGCYINIDSYYCDFLCSPC